MNQKEIGTFIANRRKQKGMTQIQLAKEMHVSDRAVSKWENGRGLPDPSNMMSLAQILDVSVNELLSAGMIEDQKEYRRKAEENLLSVMVSSSSLESMSMISLLIAVICVFPVILVSTYGVNASGWMIVICGIVIASLSIVQYRLIRKSVPKQVSVRNVFIRLQSETEIPAHVLKQVGRFETYGTQGYRGFTSLSCDQIRDMIAKETFLKKDEIEVFSSPNMWEHHTTEQ